MYRVMSSLPLPPVVDERAGPSIMESGELALALTSCSIQRNGPCTVLEQHSRAGPGGRGVGELS